MESSSPAYLLVTNKPTDPVAGLAFNATDGGEGWVLDVLYDGLAPSHRKDPVHLSDACVGSNSSPWWWLAPDSGLTCFVIIINNLDGYD